MNYSNFVPVEAAIREGLACYGNTSTNAASMMDMAMWVVEAERKIGTRAATKHYECKIPVVDKRAELPANVSSIWGIKVGCHHATMSNADFIWSGRECPFKVSIQGSCILIGDGKPGVPMVDEIEVSYDGIVCDDRGIPMVRETHVDAIKWYIAWHLAIINREINMMDRFERLWGQNCAQARGDDNMPDPLKMDSLVPIWTSMIPADWRFRNGMEGM